MTTQGVAAQARRQATWRGQASDHRRQQVRARGPVPVPTTPTGPGPGSVLPRSTTGCLPALETQWHSLVDVLEALAAPSYALLSTAAGFPLKAYGYDVTDLVTAARAGSRAFESRRADAVFIDDVAALEFDSGATQTVIAAIATGHGQHLLSVTADGVSMPVLRAWTHHTAARLRPLLDQS